MRKAVAHARLELGSRIEQSEAVIDTIFSQMTNEEFTDFYQQACRMDFASLPPYTLAKCVLLQMDKARVTRLIDSLEAVRKSFDVLIGKLPTQDDPPADGR